MFSISPWIGLGPPPRVVLTIATMYFLTASST